MCEQQRLGMCWHGEGVLIKFVYAQLAIMNIKYQNTNMRQPVGGGDDVKDRGRGGTCSLLLVVRRLLSWSFVT